MGKFMTKMASGKLLEMEPVQVSNLISGCEAQAAVFSMGKDPITTLLELLKDKVKELNALK